MTEQKKPFDDLNAVKILVEALEKFNEEERTRIIRWACERLGTQYKIEGAIPASQSFLKDVEVPGTIGASSSRSVDIKTFVNSKKPTNDAQFVAVIAYYYKFEAPEEMKKEFISSEDLNEAARLTDRDRFIKPAATLNNVYAKSGYLDRVESGKYKINTVGENLVAMVLPDEDGKKINKKKKISRTKKVQKRRLKKK